MITILYRSNQEEKKPEVQKPKKIKRKSKVSQEMEKYEERKKSNPAERVFIRDPINQGIGELKNKKMNGEILTVTIGDLIRNKQNEREKQQQKDSSLNIENNELKSTG